MPYLIVLIILLLSGCSQRVDTLLEVVEQAASPLIDDPLVLSAEEVAQLTFAAQYIQTNPADRFVSPLVQVENSRLRWQVGQHQFIDTLHGRLIASRALADVPAYVSALDDDPLKCLRQSLQINHGCPQEWLRRVVLESFSDSKNTFSERKSFWVVSHIKRSNTVEAVTLLNGSTLDAYKITEQGKLATEEQSAVIFENIFWQEAQTGRIIKSKQYLHSELGYFEIEELVPFVGEVKVL